MKIGHGSRVLSFIIAGSMFAGCATVFSGKTQELSFTSNPDGATVTISGKIIGKTPITTTLKKEKGLILVFSKDGYKPLTMRLETHIDGWVWGNILGSVAGLFSTLTDDLTGAINEYSPSQYMVTLQPEDSNKMNSNSSMSQRQKAKEYLVVGYKDIISDLGRGKGQYLTSLFELLNVPANQRDEATKKIRALSEVYTNIPDFADRVIDLYLK